jgi:hypothetical protein
MDEPEPSPFRRAAFHPEQVLLLHADPADAVTRTLLSRGSELGCPIVAVSLEQLIDEVRCGAVWTMGAQRIDPPRTALVNRLPIADPPMLGDAATSGVARQAVWSRLREELGRFGYASALPSANSLIGCFGSLVDQWSDLPRIVPGLHVPAHSTAADPRPLTGEVFSVNRWALYSLGQPQREAVALPAGLRLDYVRPAGRLVTLAQVGDTMFFANPPPEMTAAQRDAIVAFGRARAARSRLRILEHVFFLGDDAPVLYSSCPVPVIGGGHPNYPELVIQGLRNDIEKGGRPDRP